MTRRSWSSIFVVIVLCKTALCQTSACLSPLEAQAYARLSAPAIELAYRFAPQRLTVGTFFVVDVVVCSPDNTTAIDEIRMDARMPAHQHGMNYRPTVTQLSPGRFRFEGSMLHMPGHWEITFEIRHGGQQTRLTHPIEIQQ